MKKSVFISFTLVLILLAISCNNVQHSHQYSEMENTIIPKAEVLNPVNADLVKDRLAIYAHFKLSAETGIIKPMLQYDLDRLEAANIPVDIVFEQGVEKINLK